MFGIWSHHLVRKSVLNAGFECHWFRFVWKGSNWHFSIFYGFGRCLHFFRFYWVQYSQKCLHRCRLTSIKFPILEQNQLELKILIAKCLLGIFPARIVLNSIWISINFWTKKIHWDRDLKSRFSLKKKHEDKVSLWFYSPLKYGKYVLIRWPLLETIKELHRVIVSNCKILKWNL